METNRIETDFGLGPILIAAAIIIGLILIFVIIGIVAHKTGAFLRTKRVIDKAFGLTEERTENKFIGTWGRFWWKRFCYILFAIITLGLGTAWSITWMRRYAWGNTVVNGKKLVYTATGGAYFVKRLVWLILTIITLGIYALLFRPIREEQFLVEHLHFEGEQSTGATTKFHGGWIDFFLVRVISFLLIITLVGIPFGLSMRYNFRYANWQIDGKRFNFHGTWNSILARTVYWELLSICSLGMWFIFARHAARQRWIAEHLTVNEPFQPVAPTPPARAKKIA